MKNLSLFFVFFVPIYCFALVNETFSDGNFTENPTWTGTSSNFMVNSSFQLQSKAATTSTSFLFTASEAFDDAVWECMLKINYTTSSSNYASVYLVSDRSDISLGCSGYFVQVGGTNDEVSLFVQDGTKKTKIIDGTDKRTDGNPVELSIKVTRDPSGNFVLYSKLASENEYTSEGTVQNTEVKKCNFFGLLFSNTSTTGSDYYFDDILVTGNKAIDKELPVWKSFTIEKPDKLILGFSETMDFSNAAYILDPGMGNPHSQLISSDNTSIILTFENDFERGIIYTLYLSGLTDLAGNLPDLAQQSIGIIEKKETSDLVFNELMFENPLNSLEYLEIYNTSDKLLDISDLIFTTRKLDGSLNSGNHVPLKTLLESKSCIAFCSDADSVRNYHACPVESNIVSTSWSSLNNESATLVLANSTKDTIYNELTYQMKWHHVLVKNPKGVALELINPKLPVQDATSWHSAASEVNYGTPGYKNSQYRDLLTEISTEKMVWTEPECFSPDNDGVDDVCIIRYKTGSYGYVANVQIFNAVGVKIIQLASNILLSTEGFLSWDGRTESGRNANAGIYVLYFDLFNAENGSKKEIKMPIVVSTR